MPPSACYIYFLLAQSHILYPLGSGYKNVFEIENFFAHCLIETIIHISVTYLYTIAASHGKLLHTI